MSKKNLVTKLGKKYGATHHLCNYLEANILAPDDVMQNWRTKCTAK